jgi:hypothetical protein
VIHQTLTGTRAFAGCLGVAVLVDNKDPAHVVLYETWESAEHDGPTGSGGPALAPRTSARSWPLRPSSMYSRWLRACKCVHDGYGE